MATSKQGIWIKSHIWRDGHRLRGTIGTVDGLSAHMAEFSVDLRPIARAVYLAHQKLHQKLSQKLEKLTIEGCVGCDAELDKVGYMGLGRVTRRIGQQHLIRAMSFDAARKGHRGPIRFRGFKVDRVGFGFGDVVDAVKDVGKNKVVQAVVHTAVLPTTTAYAAGRGVVNAARNASVRDIALSAALAPYAASRAAYEAAQGGGGNLGVDVNLAEAAKTAALLPYAPTKLAFQAAKEGLGAFGVSSSTVNSAVKTAANAASSSELGIALGAAAAAFPPVGVPVLAAYAGAKSTLDAARTGKKVVNKVKALQAVASYFDIFKEDAKKQGMTLSGIEKVIADKATSGRLKAAIDAKRKLRTLSRDEIAKKAVKDALAQRKKALAVLERTSATAKYSPDPVKRQQAAQAAQILLTVDAADRRLTEIQTGRSSEAKSGLLISNRGAETGSYSQTDLATDRDPDLLMTRDGDDAGTFLRVAGCIGCGLFNF